MHYKKHTDFNIENNIFIIQAPRVSENSLKIIWILNNSIYRVKQKTDKKPHISSAKFRNRRAFSYFPKCILKIEFHIVYLKFLNFKSRKKVKFEVKDIDF